MYVEGTVLYDRSPAPHAQDIADAFNENTQLTGIDVENQIIWVLSANPTLRKGLMTLAVRDGSIPSSWLTDPALRELTLSSNATLTASRTITKLTLLDWHKRRGVPMSYHFPRLRQCILNDQKTRPHIYVPRTGRIEESWSLDMYMHCYTNRAADKARRALWLVCKRYNMPRDLRRLLCTWPMIGGDAWPIPEQWRKKDGRYAFTVASDNLKKQWATQRDADRLVDDIWWQDVNVEITAEKLKKAQKRHREAMDTLKEYKVKLKKTKKKLKKGLSDVFY